MKSKSIKALLQALPIYKNKIRPWLNGKTIEDAPKCGPKAVLYTDSEGLAFHGPFAMVTLERSGDGWKASVSGNANPATAHYADTDEALKRWAASVWHTAIRGVIVLMALAMVVMAQADDKRDRRERRVEHHNWIIERQSAGQVEGVPTTRRIVGKREIDIYPNGLMFEKGNVVGVTK
jgi:hypothetical protein